MAWDDLGALVGEGERGRPDEARRHFLRSTEIYREEYPADHPTLASLERRLAALD